MFQPQKLFNENIVMNYLKATSIGHVAMESDKKMLIRLCHN